MKPSAVLQKALATAALFCTPFAIAGPLPNEASIEVGAAAYSYKETSLGMELKGPQAFIAGRYAHGIDGTKQLVFDGRYAAGPLDYSSQSTGSFGGVPNYLLDLRGFISLRNNATFGFYDTYIGLGSRYLVNDAEGMFTTTGHYGYRRLSRYFYLPVGLTFHTDNKSIETNLEYDLLLRGQQTSYLRGYTAQNEQTKGFGLRASVLFKKDKWALGPYAHYWKIQDSKVDAGLFEPANTTTELGLKLRYDF